jgi:hypothetical protein
VPDVLAGRRRPVIQHQQLDLVAWNRIPLLASSNAMTMAF